MIYRGLIGCANPACYSKTPFAIEVTQEYLDADFELHDETQALIGAVESIGWTWDETEIDDQQTVGFFCPRCSYALDQAS